MVESEVSAEPLPSIGTVQGNKTMGTHALLMGKSTTFLEKRSRPLVHFCGDAAAKNGFAEKRRGGNNISAAMMFRRSRS